MLKQAEIIIFHPHSTRKNLEIKSLIPAQCFSAVSKRLGESLAKETQTKYNTLKRAGIEQGQFRTGDGRRIKIKVAA